MKRIIRIAICVTCVFGLAIAEPAVGLAYRNSIHCGNGNAAVSIRIVLKNTPIYPGDRHPVFVTISPQKHSAYVLKRLRWRTSNPRVFKIVGNWPVAVRPGHARLILFYKARIIGSVRLSVIKKRRHTS